MLAQYLYASQSLTAINQDLNDFIACGRSDGATIQADVLDAIWPEVSASAWRLDNAMDKCYYNELSEKAIIEW